MRSASFCSLSLLALLSASAVAAEPVAVKLELSQEFYYENDPLDVRISVVNNGDAKSKNPVESPLFDGFVVRTAAGDEVERKGQPTGPEPLRPAELGPRAFYGTVVDLAAIYPALAKVGVYDIYWSADGVLSESYRITVLPRFDPRKDYEATIRTDQGEILIDLFQDRAPLAAKSFVDLANADFYDGLQFQEVHEGEFVIAGDPRFAEPPKTAIRYPAEPSSQPLLAGSVVMKPIGATPPSNGSEFIILLKPQPEWVGQVTAFGQVIGGLDVVQKISAVPSSGRNSRPFFKPLGDVLIREVTIQEKTPAAAAPAAPASSP